MLIRYTMARASVLMYPISIAESAASMFPSTENSQYFACYVEEGNLLAILSGVAGAPSLLHLGCTYRVGGGTSAGTGKCRLPDACIFRVQTTGLLITARLPPSCFCHQHKASRRAISSYPVYCG